MILYLFFIAITAWSPLRATDIHPTFLFSISKAEPSINAQDASRSYIYGSVHSMPFGSLPHVVQQELLSKPALILENDNLKRDTVTWEQCKAWGFALNDDEPSVYDQLTDAEQTRLNQYIRKRVCPDLDIKRMNATGLMESYVQGLFMDGIDVRLWRDYTRDQKPIMGLESMHDLMPFIENYSLDELKNELSGPDFFENPELITGNELYLAGDVATVWLSNNDVREFQVRNTKWIPKLMDFYTTHPGFLACVGCDHVVGPDNILMLLQHNGFHIQRMYTDKSWRDFDPTGYLFRFIPVVSSVGETDVTAS